MKVIRLPATATVADVAHAIREVQGDAALAAIMDYTDRVLDEAHREHMRSVGVNFGRLLTPSPRDVGGQIDESVARCTMEHLRRTQVVDTIFVWGA